MVRLVKVDQATLGWKRWAKNGYTAGTSMHCAFCEMPVVKERTILENDLAWAFPSYFPIAPVHLLICPKRCVPSYEDMTMEEREALFELLTELKPALRTVYGAEGFNYAWNEGTIAGQTVPHLHIHLVTRREGDKEKLGFDPRKRFYDNDPGMLTEEEIHVIRDAVKKHL